ncbi:MAG: M48 family metalloprotease [Hyphomicrobiaceae bacterium]
MSMDTTTFAARWSDGQTAGSYRALVRLGHALEIAPEGVTEPVRWSPHRTMASVPLWPSSAEVLLRSLDHPGQTIYVEDPGFAAALLKVAPHLAAGSKRWRDIRPGLTVTAAVALVTGAVLALDLSPAAYVASLLPKDIRTIAGQQVLQVFTQGQGYCEAPEGNAALQTLTQKLKSASNTDAEFTVAVVNWELVNAFALPGEQIVVTRGLIEKAQSGDEVAGVVAHEMGHGIELHPEAGMVRAIGIAAAAELVFTGSSGTVGTLGTQMLELSYSRSAEREADEHALRILKEARISPKPLAEFFDRLAKEFDEPEDGSDAYELFSTHPPSPERSKLAAEAATYDSEPAMTSADWAALKAVCAGQPTVEDAPPEPSQQPPLPPT